jgi:hypothetical protein
MHCRWFIPLVCLMSVPVIAAERTIDLSSPTINTLPKEFRSTVSGLGQPGTWKIILDDAPSQLPPLTPNAPSVTKRPVLAQLATDPTDEHFPLLILGNETYGDFTLTARFKTVSGSKEQMAGLAFRIQDDRNYYVVRASSLGSTVRFYRFLNGERSQPIGADLPIPSGTWHELAVECKGNTIRCLLNGKEVIPTMTDYTFTGGGIGLWTKSDSVSYFTDIRIVYTPREILAETLVREAIQKNPRLQGLKIYAFKGDPPQLVVVASNYSREVGEPGGDVERDVISRDVTYSGRTRSLVSATLPLHDRNGEVVAAVRVVMKAFPGQTDQTTLARAMPVVQGMEPSIRSAKDLLLP